MKNVTESNEYMLRCGERLRKCRKESGYTQAKLAELIMELPENRGKERNEKQISYIESGQRALSADYANLIAKVLHVSASYLMLEENFKNEKERFSWGLDRMESRTNVLHALISEILKHNHYEIKYIREDTDTISEARPNDPFYAIVKNGAIVAYLSLEEYVPFRNEIAHYTEYLFNGVMEKALRSAAYPIKLPKEGANNG